jgi:hypothetical protein
MIDSARHLPHSHEMRIREEEAHNCHVDVEHDLLLLVIAHGLASLRLCDVGNIHRMI